jgi:hypothetical protein
LVLPLGVYLGSRRSVVGHVVSPRQTRPSCVRFTCGWTRAWRGLGVMATR